MAQRRGRGVSIFLYFLVVLDGGVECRDRAGGVGLARGCC